MNDRMLLFWIRPSYEAELVLDIYKSQLYAVSYIESTVIG